jgi:hypothetical protein
MKIKSILKIFFFTFSISMIFGACQWITIEPVETDKPEGPVSFSQQIQPIFTQKCIACHASRNPVLTEGNAYNSLMNGGYVNVQDPPASRIIIQLNTGHGNSTPNERTLILTWIEQGALNN